MEKNFSAKAMVLHDKVNSYNFENLVEYGCLAPFQPSLHNLYKEIIKEVTEESVQLSVSILTSFPENSVFSVAGVLGNGMQFSFISKATFTKADIKKVLLEEVLEPYETNTYKQIDEAEHQEKAEEVFTVMNDIIIDAEKGKISWKDALIQMKAELYTIKL